MKILIPSAFCLLLSASALYPLPAFGLRRDLSVEASHQNLPYPLSPTPPDSQV